jgi:stage V sporulation protein AC
MANKNTKNVTPTQKEYQDLAKRMEPKRPVFTNCLKAFFVGGSICLFGQILQEMFMHYFHFDQSKAGNPTVACLIFISVVLTSFGVYDKFAQWAGAGSAVPVTGFANAMASAAIEYRSEGLVLGTGSNMFKLAGSVIVFGTFSAFVIGIIYLIFGISGG